MHICENIIKHYTNGYLRLFSLNYIINGAYPIPKGPKIIAANHPNATDSFHLVPALEETPHFLMRSNLFSKPVIGWLLRKAGQIEVGSQGKKSFENACALLQQGHTIVLYPEGKLNPGYEKLKAKSGAVRMSLTTSVPIIPLGIYVKHKNIKDMRRVLNGRISKSCWQVSGACYLRFGMPWMPNVSGVGRNEIFKLSQKLMNKINSLVDENRKEQSCVLPTSLNPIPQW